MNYEQVTKQAQLTREHCHAIAKYSQRQVIEDWLADRNFNSLPLSSVVLTQLLDAGDIKGHDPSGNTLGNFDALLAEAVTKIEAALPRVNPLEVNESDPFGK